MGTSVQEPKAVDNFLVLAQKVQSIEDMDQKQLSALQLAYTRPIS